VCDRSSADRVVCGFVGSVWNNAHHVFKSSNAIEQMLLALGKHDIVIQNKRKYIHILKHELMMDRVLRDTMP
jgi:hypothetical protein